jgi:hypothetical protein
MRNNITTTLLRLVLLNVLAISAGAITAASASAAEPVFAFCHDVAGQHTNGGTYSDAHCTSLVNGGGLYAVAYADTLTSLLLCLWVGVNNGLYKNDHCSELGIGNWEKTLVTENTPLLLGKPINTAVLHGELLSTKTLISCTAGNFLTHPEEKGASSHGLLEYKTCSTIPTNCVVKEPILATFNDQLEGNKLDKFTGNKTNGTKTEIFTEIEYLNNGSETCALKGTKFPIKGSQTCEGGSLINLLALLQELECTPEGSNLKLGPETATFENQVSVTAESGEAWGVLLITP